MLPYGGCAHAPWAVSSKVFPNAAFGYWKVTVERPLRLKGIDPERVYVAKEVKALKETAERADDAPAAIRKVHRKSTAPDPLRGLFAATIDGRPAVAEYEPDPDLRDTEQVPLLEEGGIEAFLRREVLPHAPDAWYDPASVKTGYEISFTRYFYKPQPLRTLAAIRADILALEQETEGLTDQHLDTIIGAFGGYKGGRGTRVLLQGIGRYNRQNRLLGLDSIEHISLLDPLDIPARLDEFRGMKDGWLDGKGVALSHDGLDWLASGFDRRFPEDLPLPYVYPTPEGAVQAEWSLAANDVSLEVNLATHQGEWHALDLATNEEGVRSLSLDGDGDWAWLVTEIRRMAGGAA